MSFGSSRDGLDASVMTSSGLAWASRELLSADPAAAYCGGIAAQMGLVTRNRWRC